MVGVPAAPAVLLAPQGHRERAQEPAVLVKRHPAEASAAQEQASQLATELVHQVPEEAFRLTQTRSSSTTLEDMIAESTLSLEA